MATFVFAEVDIGEFVVSAIVSTDPDVSDILECVEARICSSELSVSDWVVFFTSIVSSMFGQANVATLFSRSFSAFRAN